MYYLYIHFKDAPVKICLKIRTVKGIIDQIKALLSEDNNGLYTLKLPEINLEHTMLNVCAILGAFLIEANKLALPYRFSLTYSE